MDAQWYVLKAPHAPGVRMVLVVGGLIAAARSPADVRDLIDMVGHSWRPLRADLERHGFTVTEYAE